MNRVIISYRACAGLFAACLALLSLLPLASQDLGISPVDLRIEQRADGGYHLYIRAKPGVGSVLLTETTKDPQGQADNYAYRAESWNEYNGNEQRLLDGQFIPADSGLYFLIDSSPEPDSQFGSAFHIFIPWVVEWGYSWTRNGRTFLADGTFINIRSFTLPYADYSGAFLDNPYQISVTQRPFERPPAPVAPQALIAPIPPPQTPATEPVAEPEAAVAPEPEPEPPQADASIFMPSTLEAFTEIAKSNDGSIQYSWGTEDIVPRLARLIDAVPGESLDLVICIDTTASMEDDIDALRALLPDMIRDKTARFRNFRLGLVTYKDYFEEYVVQKHPFTSALATFVNSLNRIRVRGGGDIPEAVYEALHEGLTGFDWLAPERMMVLIGDAPPHPIPRGRINKSTVDTLSAALKVQIDVIILPH